MNEHRMDQQHTRAQDDAQDNVQGYGTLTGPALPGAAPALVVSSYTLSAGGSQPTESVSLTFGQITYRYVAKA